MNWQKYKETVHCASIGIGLPDGQYVLYDVKRQ